MDTPFYITLYFKVFVCIYAILGIITSFFCYKLSKKNNLTSTVFWIIIGWVFPIIPYLYLKNKYKEFSKTNL
ncbi:MAG: hypothetical protein DRJ01_19195 [Bacteroidetes bacterium]|nr:MAG: hypothetical protein DRJ01_19195 [Bacteroidota bacterium]